MSTVPTVVIGISLSVYEILKGNNSIIKIRVDCHPCIQHCYGYTIVPAGTDQLIAASNLMSYPKHKKLPAF